MATVVGIDNGYLNTKNSNRNVFKSSFSRTDDTLSGKNKLTIDGVNYYFGIGNTTNTDHDKTDSVVNMVCGLGSLSYYGSGEYYVVCNLPVEQYKSMKDKYRDAVLGYNKLKVLLNDTPFNFTIKDVSVIAQGVAALYNVGLPDGDYISFDLGSYTTNVALLTIKAGIPYIVKYNTWYNGILTLYDKIVKITNEKYNISIDNTYAEKILMNRRLQVYGNWVDVSYIKPILRDYLDGVFSKFKPNYPYATETIVFSGGGSIALWDIFDKNFPNSILLPDSQYANAIGCYNYGILKYGKYVK